MYEKFYDRLVILRISDSARETKNFLLHDEA